MTKARYSTILPMAARFCMAILAGLILGNGLAAAREERPSRLKIAYRYEATIGRKGNGQGHFLHANGIAVDPLGNVYVADTGNDRIQKLGPEGQYLTEVGAFGWEMGQFNRPVAVATSKSGLEVYVADSRNSRIQVFNPHFRVLGVLGGRDAEGPLRLGTLGGIGVSEEGEIYVTDTELDQVVQIDTYSLMDQSYGGQGYGAGRMQKPQGLAVGAFTYVCDAKNDRIAVFDRFGNYIRSLGEGSLSDPSGVCLGPNRSLFVADTGHNRVLAIDLDGAEIVEHIGGTESGDGEVSFNSPRDVACRGEILYVLDTGNNRIQKYRVLALRK
jgi:DNA-binding beta-propeller fold protein YncE